MTRATGGQLDVDVDAPWQGPVPSPETRHPIAAMIDQVTDLLGGLGFVPTRSPLVEDVLHSFDLLGVPEGHATRSPAHTFYLDDGGVLRSHTTSSVVRVLREEPGRAERRILVGGACFRNTTESPRFVTQFHQMEAAAVGPEVVLGDALGLAEVVLDDLLGPHHEARFRFRPLPYVSPGFSVDASCSSCDRAGCQLCGGRGFLEVISGGALTAAVRSAAKIPDGSNAVAVAVSLERLLAIRHRVADIRPFLSRSLQDLSQIG